MDGLVYGGESVEGIGMIYGEGEAGESVECCGVDGWMHSTGSD